MIGTIMVWAIALLIIGFGLKVMLGGTQANRDEV
jgi:hypothetical protein